MKADIKIIVTKIIIWIVILMLFVVGINIGLWKTGALEESVEKYRKEHATTTKAVITTVPPVKTTTAGNTTQNSLTGNGNVAEKSFVADFTVVNKWSGHFQYGIIIENRSDTILNTWKIDAQIPQGCVISDSWNCNVRIENDRVIITPTDYNSRIDPGGKITNIGIIFVSEKEMLNFQYKVGIDEMVKITGGEVQTPSADSNVTESTDITITQIKPSKETTTTRQAPLTETTATQQAPSTEIITTQSPSIKETKPTETTQLQTPPQAEHKSVQPLSVNGVRLIDANGHNVQLKGVSTHGIAWFPEYVNKDAFQTLRDKWGVNTVRLALYTAEYNGYCTGGDKAKLMQIIDNGVKYATELDMYVIIDWHILSDGNPNTYKSEAKSFFTEMARKYSSYSNVIYEICNEPNSGVSWNEVKSYADEIISVIRTYDADAIILVGTPTWSQEIDKVVNNPVTNEHNVMYVLHFYAATHKEDLRNRMRNAIASGVPVFISEFSICDASGNGGIDYVSANEWKNLIDAYNISYVGWNLSNKNETSALINSSCKKISGWNLDDLSDTGKWLMNTIKNDK